MWGLTASSIWKALITHCLTQLQIWQCSAKWQSISPMMTIYCMANICCKNRGEKIVVTCGGKNCHLRTWPLMQLGRCPCDPDIYGMPLDSMLPPGSTNACNKAWPTEHQHQLQHQQHQQQLGPSSWAAAQMSSTYSRTLSKFPLIPMEATALQVAVPTSLWNPP